MTRPGLSTDDVLILLQQVAAQVITPRFRQLQRHEVNEKSPGSLVTIADHEAEVAITGALQRAYPNAVILGEEAHEDNPALLAQYQEAEHAFTVDPVDGTRNFVDGNPDHAVMVAEVRHGITTRAWIWQPEHRTAWVAELGAGAWRDGARLSTRAVPAGTDPQGVTGIWSLRGRQLPNLPPMQHTWMCCGVDYPKLIEGETDFIVYKRSWPWDHAPGALLVTEAGGAVSHPDGEAYEPRSVRPWIIAASDPDTLGRVRQTTADL